MYKWTRERYSSTLLLSGLLIQAKRGKFDYIVLICPTFVFNKTYDYFVDNKQRIYVINCQQH